MLDFDDSPEDLAIFEDIERLELDQISSTNSIEISADALAAWTGGEDITLDIANNTQGAKITINDTQSQTDITNIAVNSSYTVVPEADPNLAFNMAVV